MTQASYCGPHLRTLLRVEGAARQRGHRLARKKEPGMPRLKTREVTLHRLPHVVPTHEGMFDALTEAVGAGRLDGIGADPQPITITGSPALWIDGQFSAQKSDWCADASRTTGLNASYGNTHSAGLLLIAVDSTVYAIGYGGGHRLIPDELTDPRFGLRFAIRRLDPGQIQDFVRRGPGSRGRTDATSIDRKSV